MINCGACDPRLSELRGVKGMSRMRGAAHIRSRSTSFLVKQRLHTAERMICFSHIVCKLNRSLWQHTRGQGRLSQTTRSCAVRWRLCSQIWALRQSLRGRCRCAVCVCVCVRSCTQLLDSHSSDTKCLTQTKNCRRAWHCTKVRSSTALSTRLLTTTLAF